MEKTQTFLSQSPEDTLRLGSRIASRLQPGRSVLMTGELGAGKSVLARGIAMALGVDAWRGSPTFALVHEYDTHPVLYHADLYRLSAVQIEELGLEEYARDDSIFLVEWADRAQEYVAGLTDTPPVSISFSFAGASQRLVEVRGLEQIVPISADRDVGA